MPSCSARRRRRRPRPVAVTLAILILSLITLAFATLASAQGTTSNGGGISTGQSTGARLASKYDYANKAESIRKSVPCLYGDCTFDGVDDTEYFSGVALWAGPGLIVCVLTPIIALILCVCRKSCHCCGGSEPNPDGYTRKEKWRMFAIFFLLVLANAVCAILGLYSNSRMSAALTGSDEGFTAITTDLLADSRTAMNGIIQPLEDSRASLTDIELNVKSKIDNTDVLATGIGALTASVDAFAVEAQTEVDIVTPATGQAPATGLYPCVACLGLTTAAAAVVVQMNAETGPVLASMQQTVDDTKVYLTDIIDEIRLGFTSALDSIGAGTGQIDTLEEKAEQMKAKIEEVNRPRATLLYVIFLIPILSLLLAGGAGYIQSTGMFTANTYATIIGLSLVALMWALHLPLALVVGDGCEYLDSQETDFVSNLDPDLGRVLDACLLDQSLVEAFELAPDIQFRDQISFPPPVDIANQFSFSELTTLQSTVHALTITEAYALNIAGGTPVELSLASLNAAAAADGTVGGPFTIDTYTNSVTPGSTQLTLQRDTVTQANVTETQMHAVLARLRGSVDAVVVESETFKVLVARVQADLNDVETEVEPLFASIDSITTGARCGFMGDAYRRFKETLCGTTSASITFIAFTAFLVTMLSIPAGCLSMRLHKRFDGPTRDELQEMEMQHRSDGGGGYADEKSYGDGETDNFDDASLGPTQRTQRSNRQASISQQVNHRQSAFERDSYTAYNEADGH